MKLTVNEINLLNAMRTNEYNDCIEYATWSFTVVDNSGLDAKKARGVISSLVKKGLVVATKAKASDDEDMLGLTEAGKEIFANANGAECSWGGPRLLEVPAAKKVASPDIEVFAFTGMSLGVFPIVSQTARVTIVQTKKGELSFATKTGVQLDAKNPKFANRIK